MKRRFFLALAWVLSVQVSFGQDQEKASILSLHEEKFQWLIRKDYAALESLLAPDLQFIHSNGWVQSRQEVLDDLKSGKLNYTGISVEEASVRLYDNCSIVTGKGRFRGLMPDKSTFELRLLYTETYVKSGGRWLLAGRQAVKIQ
jgi:hypothetical protein